MTGYYAGLYGGEFVFARYFSVESQKLERAHNWFEKWGAPVLFMSWAPFIGDLLPIVAGILRVRVVTVSFWVFIGKGIRYVVLLGIAGFLW
jgi:membrane protein YqaA with SNARE-associated domain